MPEVLTTTVSLDDLTQVEIDGNGVFDVLMRSIETHLAREHAANRITGDEYAKTYTNITAAVLAQSVQFLLGKAGIELQQAKTQAELDLLAQKLVTEKAQVMDHTILDPTATEDTSYGDSPNSYHNSVQLVEGVIGDKKDVLVRQTKGYDDDFQTKMARLVADAYKVMLSNIGNADDFPTVFKNAAVNTTIADALDKADLDS